MLSSSLDTLLKVSPQKLFAYDCVTLYVLKTYPTYVRIMHHRGQINCLKCKKVLKNVTSTLYHADYCLKHLNHVYIIIINLL